METCSLTDLMSAMQAAEQKFGPGRAPLAYEDLPTLKRGEWVTIAQRRFSGHIDVYHGRVTKISPYGYTDMKGLWTCEREMSAQGRKSLRVAQEVLFGRVVHNTRQLVSSYRLCVKTEEGYSWSENFRGFMGLWIWRGWWNVAVTPPA